MTIRTLKDGNFSVKITPREKKPFISTMEILKKSGLISKSFLKSVSDKGNAYKVIPAPTEEPSYVRRSIRVITAL